MTEYSKVIEGSFTGENGVGHFVKLPFKPFKFEMWNYSEWGSDNATSQVQYAIGFQDQPDGYALVTENVSASAALENVALTTGGFTFFAGGFPASGPIKTGTVVSQANPAVVTMTSHGFVTGDTVWLWGSTGMLQIAGAPYTVTRIDANSFSIPVDSSGFAAAATAVKARLWFGNLIPDTYRPFTCNIVGITAGTSTVVTVSNQPHAFVVGQEVEFVIPDQWGMTELSGLRGYVTAISDSTLTVNINSSSFTAFSYPTSAVAAAGMTFPQVYSVGDQNTGYQGSPPSPITIPGAFTAYSTPGVVIGASLITGADVATPTIYWRATYPDQILSE